MSKLAMDVGKSKSGTMGLSYPMLSKTNYTTWSMKMRVFMQAHGVWDAVESSDPKMVLDERTDKVALAMIYQSIPEEMMLSLAEKKKAKNAWMAIKTMTQGADRVKAAKVQTLKSEFESLCMKDTELLDDFCMKLNGLVTNIRALGEEVKEAYVVKKLLRAVPTKFLQIVSTMEQFGDLETMSVEEAVGSLKAHEERLNGQTDNSGGQLLLTEEEWSRKENEDGKLLLTKEEWQRRMNKRGTNVRSRAGMDKSRVKCFNCHLYGHFAVECRKPRRTKEMRQEAQLSQTEDDEPALILAKHDKDNEVILLNETGVVPKLKSDVKQKGVGSNVWYLDNGASNHMTGDKAKFKELDTTITGRLKFGDGSAVQIKRKGSIILKCKNGEERTLHEVFYIPTLCSNIISLGQLSEKGNKVIINGEYLWVYEQHGNLLIKVKRSSNRLYKLLVETVEHACMLSKIEEATHLWHTRLGHVNLQSLVLMYKNQMVYGLPNVTHSTEVCTGCLMSKQMKKSFPSKASFIASKVLQLVHADLCGPIEPATSAGNKYFFLLVDDYSRVMWVYMLKNKSEAFCAFKKFRAQVEDGLDKKIKVLRTDRGGEFMSKDFAAYCEETGIERHFTAPYTPQQNGVVERRNRTVVEMTRSYLKEMKMPSEMWGEAVRHSIYVLNRLPTRALSRQTPYEAWTGIKPNVSHIRVFGCLSHMKIPNIHSKKLDDRSMQVVNLGREPGTKAYRVYDPVTKRVYVSRDVVFEESKCWPWSQQEEEGSSNVETVSIINVCMPGDVVQSDTGHEQISDVAEPQNAPPPQQTDGGISS